MLDFTTTECSKGMYIYCYAFFLIISTFFWNKYSNRNKTKKLDKLFFFLILIYVITSFYNGDFWHLQAYVVHDDEYWKPSESIYDSIIELVKRNYLLFRIIVWGSGLLIIKEIIKKYKLNLNTTLFYYFCLYISVFDYARASLAMAVYFWGLSYFTIKNNCFNRIIGLALILSSFLFHTSMLAIIGLTFFIYLPINKKTLILISIIFPLSSIIINYIVESIIAGNGMLDVIIMKLSGIQDSELDDKTLMEKFRLTWHYSTFYIPFFIITYKIYFQNDYKEFPIHIHKLYNITLGIILFATSTLFLGFSNPVLFYRFLYMSMIPLTLLFCYLNEHGYVSLKTYKRILLLGILYINFRHSKVLLRWSGPLS